MLALAHIWTKLEGIETFGSVPSHHSEARNSMTSYLDPLGLVQLPRLMQRTSGAKRVRIGLIDGPVETSHADLATDRIEAIGG